MNSHDILSTGSSKQTKQLFLCRLLTCGTTTHSTIDATLPADVMHDVSTVDNFHKTQTFSPLSSASSSIPNNLTFPIVLCIIRLRQRHFRRIVATIVEKPPPSTQCHSPSNICIGTDGTCCKLSLNLSVLFFFLFVIVFRPTREQRCTVLAAALYGGSIALATTAGRSAHAHRIPPTLDHGGGGLQCLECKMESFAGRTFMIFE
mmetsp:Transcript_11700/g.21628  ORF Transcript_11700/g.21628 Transcript_11700/m.21628 type:complete len:204 (-) Transcript_11700:1762-2373(-)